jgi:flagellar hook-basal body complex protein FliE
MSIQSTNAALAYSKSSLLNSSPVANNNDALTANIRDAFGNFGNILRTASATNAAMMIADEVLEKTDKKRKGGLKSLVEESTNSVLSTLRKSEHITAKAIVDEANITDVVAVMANAETALNSMVTIRDKVIAAYQDIIKMQI